MINGFDTHVARLNNNKKFNIRNKRGTITTYSINTKCVITNIMNKFTTILGKLEEMHNYLKSTTCKN